MRHFTIVVGGALLSGCATLETGADHVRDFAVKHPVLTAVGSSVLITGAVLSLDHHHETRTTMPERTTCGAQC